MVKMIAMDLDGTLLRSDGSIHPETREALQEAERRGLVIALCSGRPPHLIAGIARNLGIDTAMVALNGGVVYSRWGTEPLFTSFLSRYAQETGIKICRELGLQFSLYGEFRLRRMNELGPTTDLTTDFSSEVVEGERSYKMVGFVDSSSQMPLLRRRWEEIEGVELTQSWATGLEMNAAGTNKGAGLKHLCDELGLSTREVMAFGDHDNDRAMFRVAGYPVAMGNAIDSLKELAWETTATNDDNGIGLALCRWVLK